MMFYDGDLQGGINKALQEDKFVACFVHDDEGESKLWESALFMDDQLAALFAEKTVLLRLKSDSQEAGYLAAIYPLPKIPTLVIIHNGQLKEYVTAGVTQKEFIRRVTAVLGEDSNAPAAGFVYGGPTSSSAAETAVNPAITSDPPTPEIQSLLEERRQKLEAAEQKRVADEKAARAARAAAQQAALDAAVASDPKRMADRKYQLQQKKRQKDAREERERILKRVEDDKIERKAREALRKEHAIAAAGEASQGPTLTAASSSLQSAPTSKATQCALQVRLFDGSTIRSRFTPQSTLSTDIRAWIDGQRADGEDAPYTFRQVLTPLPNRLISTSEEEQSLESLGLALSATLILVPVKDYTSAYTGGAGGLVSRGVSAGFGLLSSGVGLVTGTLGGILGGGPAQDVNTEAPAAEDRPGGHQLYNGNSQNLESRPEDLRKEE